MPPTFHDHPEEHGKKKPVAQVDHAWPPAPLWTSVLGLITIPTPDVLKSGRTCCLGRKAECPVLAAQDAVLTHFIPTSPKGLVSAAPMCYQQYQLPLPGALTQ